MTGHVGIGQFSAIYVLKFGEAAFGTTVAQGFPLFTGYLRKWGGPPEGGL